MRVARENRPFVLALAGPPGAGKTTLAMLLQRRHTDARFVSFDRHQTLLRLSQAQIRNWFTSGADLGRLDDKEIVADLTREIMRDYSAARNRPLLIFETPFGRLHAGTAAFINFLVWIDTPLDLALSRAVLGFTQAAQREATPNAAREFISWQIQYMKFYPTLRTMYLSQRERVAAGADLSIDGMRSPEASAQLIEKVLKSRGLE